MAVGLVFGTLSTVPAALLVYTALRQPTRPRQAHNVTVEVVRRLALPASEPPMIDGTCTAYSTARPFALLEVDR
jgi:hypothetical protein